MSITQPPFSCEVEMSITFTIIIIVQSWSTQILDAPNNHKYILSQTVQMLP